MCRKLIYLVSFVLLLGLTGVLNAAVIGFQAESGTLGAHFDPPIIDPNALGGQYITIETPSGGGSPGHEDRVATYTVTFPEAGTYDLYARLYIDTAIQGAADNDSMFYGNGFGTKPANSNADWIQINGCDNLTSDVWFWINLSEDTCQWGEAGVSFTVPAGGLTQTLQVGGREDGLRMDAFVFATSTLVLTDWELDAAVPQETKAFGADPADGSLYSGTSVNLSWQPGAYATEHHVYFSEVFDDVNDRTDQADKGLTTELTYAVSGLVPGTVYYWAVDEVSGSDIWPGDVWSFQIESETAYNPYPYDGEISIDPEVVLAWSPGVYAVSNNVYLDKVKENVDARSGCLVNGVSTADPNYSPGPLEFNTTYYWAIDEVGGPPDNTIYTGAVWSFTTMPDIQLYDPNLVGWWTFDEADGRTALDWSGHGNHGAIQGNPVWVAGYDDDGNALDFDGLGDYVNCGNAEIFNITEQITVAAWMRVDVFEQTDQSIVSKGEAAWKLVRNELTDQLRFDCGDVGQAVGSINVNDGELHHVAGVYDGSMIYLYVDGGVDAGSAATGLLTTDDITVFIADTNRPGEGPQAWNGLIDDVRIYNKALTQEEIEQLMRGDPRLAWKPYPPKGSTPDVENVTALSWMPGDNAVEHDVYFGIDRSAVEDADASDITGIYQGRQLETTYVPSEALQMGQTYYWRIDEYNADATISKGKVWSFTVAGYLIVDDFEDYNDYKPDRIFDTWIDGWQINENGSIVGYGTAPFAEQTITNSGVQSMPFFYNNTGGVAYSEAIRTFDSLQDWTRRGVQTLTLFFRGYPAAFVEDPTGTYAMGAGGEDIWDVADEFRYAYKTLSGDGSITARVVSIEDTHEWAKAGVMIRDTLDNYSVHAFMCVTPSNRRSFQNRRIIAETSYQANSNIDAITLPLWVRVVRQGINFTGYYSEDENHTVWIQQPTDENTGDDASPNPQNIVMSQNVYIGLAYTSHNVDAMGTAVFEGVETTGTVTGDDWQVTAIGADMPSNEAQPLYVVVRGGGVEKTVEHPDNPNAVQQYTWQQWDIPLSVLSDAGVTLSSIQDMTIGVGGSGQDGTGTLYFDDIRLYPAEE